jgi:hypothetical protein
VALDGVVIITTALRFLFLLFAAAIIIFEDIFEFPQATMTVTNQTRARIVGGGVVVTALIMATACGKGGN